MKKVLVVCGNGLGSSFIMEMNVKKALNELGKEPELSHTDLASSKTEQADIYLGAEDIMHNLEDGTRQIVTLQNVMNIEEIKEKISPLL